MVTSADHQAAFLIAALLSRRRDLEYRVRSAVIGAARHVDAVSDKDMDRSLSAAFQSAGFPEREGRRQCRDGVRRAFSTAEEWIKEGVFLVRREELKATCASLHNLPQILWAWGDRSLLDPPAAVVLNSRKPRSLSPEDPWLQTTKRMCRTAIRRGFALVSSYGTVPYMVVSLLAKHSPLLVACDRVLPFMEGVEARERFLAEYEDLFHLDTTLFVSPFPPGRVPSRAQRWVERDHLAAALASHLFVAEIRAGGTMDAIVAAATKRGIAVEGQSRGAASDRGQHETAEQSIAAERTGRACHAATGLTKARQRGRLATEQPPCESQVPPVEALVRKGTYLFHYTRSCPGPWPGETAAQYCRSLVEGKPTARHTAFDTLIRILDQGLIRGSHRLTRGRTPVVCFTECCPWELPEISVWRAGLGRWSFEPYALAFRKEELFRLGARPVIYGVEGAFGDLTVDLKDLFQVQRPDRRTWAAEREWRIRGDLALSAIARDNLLVVLPSSQQAHMVARRFRVRVARSDRSLDLSAKS